MYSRNLIEITYPYLDLKIEELRLAMSTNFRNKKKKSCFVNNGKRNEDKNFKLRLKRNRKQLEKDRDFKNMVAKVTELLKEAKMMK